jgi:predicted Rossmann fold flavoprotein
MAATIKNPPAGDASTDYDLVVVGGGASGFFTALQAADYNPNLRIILCEQGSRFLQKVRISGGGRCNVSHACFDPDRLSQFYPRGRNQLRAAFHRWQPKDTERWFADRGVPLKTEPDGRMFPKSDSSETIIDCFLNSARDHNIALHTRCGLLHCESLPNQTGWQLHFDNPAFAVVKTHKVCIAVGSLKNNHLQRQIESLGHAIAPLAPSLFAVNCSDRRLSGLAGVAVDHVNVSLSDSRQCYQGPLLITHRGLSGPAVLRLSAWEARSFAERNYHTGITVDWLPLVSRNDLEMWCEQQRIHNGIKAIHNTPPIALPKRLWQKFCDAADCADARPWNQFTKPMQRQLLDLIKSCHFAVTGKTTNKDEFVTCGGISLKEVDFRTMQSKLCPNLYFAGECLDIDGITGGFNFQAAWTTASIAAKNIAESSSATLTQTL